MSKGSPVTFTYPLVREVLTANVTCEDLHLSHVLVKMGEYLDDVGFPHAIVFDPKTAAVRSVDKWVMA
jgi:hypothetical protein